MKQLKFISIFICLICNCLNTIHGQPTKFEFILTGGPGKAEFYDRPTGFYTEITEVLAGYAGVLFQYHFTDRLSIKTGVAYERNGSQIHFKHYEFDTGWGDDYTDCYMHPEYLSIPFLTQMEIGNRFRFYLNVGGYCSFLVNYSYDIITNGNEAYGTDIKVSPESAQEEMKIDLGVSAEAGFKVIILRKYSASLGLTDHWGLLNSKKMPDFEDIYGQPMNSNNDSKNNAYYIVAGFSYLIDSFKK